MHDVLAWLIALRVLSLVAFPAAHLLLGRLADRGWSVSATLGLLILAWVSWMGGSIGVLPNSSKAIAGVLLAMVAGSIWLAYQQRAQLADFFRRRWTVVVGTEVLFLVMFAFWALVISEAPAINHTEKPMDFGILNAIVNAETFPPEDQWLAGHSIAYYYGGHYVAAMLTTLTGVPAATAYNLAIATVPALLAAGLLGLVYNLLRFAGGRVIPSLATGAAAAVSVLSLGNLIGLLELAYVRGFGGDGFWGWVGIKGLEGPAGGDGWLPDGFWWWWRGTRVIDTLGPDGASLDYTITEFPFFSFLLGDLHAHVTTLPFLLLALAFTLVLLVSPEPPGLDWLRRRPWEATALAVAIGALAFMNAWDFPVYIAIVGMAAAARWFAWQTMPSGPVDSNNPRLGNALAGSVGRAALLAVGLAAAGLVLYQPFYLSFDSQAGGILPVTGPATRPFHFLLVIGVPALLAAGLVARTVLYVGWPTPRLRVIAWTLLAVSVAPLLVWLVAVGLRLSVSPDDVTLADGVVAQRLMLALPLSLMGGLAGYCGLALIVGRRPMQWLVFALLLASAGFYLLAGAELFHIADQFGNRMNTVFKVYYQAWLLLGIAGAVGIHYIVVAPLRRSDWDLRVVMLRILGVAYGVVATVFLVASAYYPVGAIVERTGWADTGESWQDNTLSGLSYLRASEPGEYEAIEWLSNPDNIGRIVEAVGDDYTDYARISATTGRATILGWKGHQRQWRGDDQAFAGREEDVATIYESADADTVRRLLERYEVRWVVVGPREVSTYGPDVPTRMLSWTDAGWLNEAFASNDVVIYEFTN